MDNNAKYMDDKLRELRAEIEELKKRPLQIFANGSDEVIRVLKADLAAERKKAFTAMRVFERYRELEAQIVKLREALEDFVSYGCPACGGDCASANPPVALCPMQNARAVLAETKGDENGDN
jgi:rubrerythrin